MSIDLDYQRLEQLAFEGALHGLSNKEFEEFYAFFFAYFKWARECFPGYYTILKKFLKEDCLNALIERYNHDRGDGGFSNEHIVDLRCDIARGFEFIENLNVTSNISSLKYITCKYIFREFPIWSINGKSVKEYYEDCAYNDMELEL